MTASSEAGPNLNSYDGRVNMKKGWYRWCPSTKTDQSDYLQVDIGAVRDVCAVATQRRHSEHAKTYYLQISVDGVNWNTYKENKAKKVNCNLVSRTFPLATRSRSFPTVSVSEVTRRLENHLERVPSLKEADALDTWAQRPYSHVHVRRVSTWSLYSLQIQAIGCRIGSWGFCLYLAFK